MKRTKMLRVAAVTVLGLSLGAGVASAAPGNGSVTNTGPDSDNIITFNNMSSALVSNTNGVTVTNTNPQAAVTGAAAVTDNTTGGGAASGDATNDSMLRGSLRISNVSAGAAALNSGGSASTGSISTTGPDSTNVITFNNSDTSTVANTNTLLVSNVNTQTASSGAAVVDHNTTGGSATSGDASNVSTVDLTVEVNN